MSKDFREVGGRDSPALCILFSNGIFAEKKKVSFHGVTKAMFTFYVLRNGRRLQTAASRPRSTKNLSSDGRSPIFESTFLLVNMLQHFLQHLVPSSG